MLGWPSPTYPGLIRPDSPIPITMDQSAMIAGFLMIGNTVSAPFSAIRKISPKYGIIIGATFMTIGWVLMWQAQDMNWLLASRFFIGAGNGFGTGQVKYYISEICQDFLGKIMIKQVNAYIFLGVFLAFIYGPFVGFRNFSIITTILCVLVVFLAIFLPVTPRDLVKSGKMSEAKKLIEFLSPHLDVREEIVRIKERISTPDKSLSFCDIMRKKNLRSNFVVFACLMMCQNLSGAPATMVYAQMIFTKAHCPKPELCAIVYCTVFFLANLYGIFCIPNYNKRNVLLFSSVGVSVLLVVNILVLFEKLNDNFWQFTSLVVLLLYILVHTVGLGNVPFLLIPEFFPSEANQVIVIFYLMFHSMLTLTITKIFQVMFHNLGLILPLCLFLTTSSISIIFVIIFVPSKSNKPNDT